MIVLEIELCNLFKFKLSKQESEVFTLILEERAEKKFEENEAVLATKRGIKF